MFRLQRLVDKFQLTLHALFCLLEQRDSKTLPKISENHSAGNESNRIANPDTRFLSSKRRDVIKLTSSLSNSAIRSCLETPLALFALLKHQCKRNAFKRNLTLIAFKGDTARQTRSTHITNISNLSENVGRWLLHSMRRTASSSPNCVSHSRTIH
jgi:hypothetical protein